jgi:predicted FMN-binding regulatory protein PaiB
MEGKFKLSQNRAAADRVGIIAALQNSSEQTEREVAQWMSRIELPLQA